MKQPTYLATLNHVKEILPDRAGGPADSPGATASRC